MEINMTNKILTRDEQIEFARDIDFKMRGIKAIMERATADINNLYLTTIDKDIKSDLGIMFEGIRYATETLTSTIHDACIDNYKTEDDMLYDEPDKCEENAYRVTRDAIYTENKL